MKVFDLEIKLLLMSSTTSATALVALNDRLTDGQTDSLFLYVPIAKN